MADIRFSDLLPLDATTIDDLDIFAVSDTDNTASKKITFGDLKEAIVSTDFFTDNAKDIVDALNAFDYDANASGTINNLNATQLYHNTGLIGTSGYKDSTYYLDYDNFTNTPTIPRNLSDMYNNNRYLQFEDGSVNPQYPNGRIIYRFEQFNENGNPTTNPAITISSKYVVENTNLYYTDARVATFFDENFGDYYNQLSSAFDSGLIRDSLQDTPATFTGVTVGGSSSTVEIADIDLFENYQVGQTLRIFGASLVDEEEDISTAIANGFTYNVTTSGFPTTQTDPPQTPVKFRYKLALFNLTNGNISAATSTFDEVLVYPTPEVGDVYNQFNSDYFIKLQFSSIPTGRGILVYRAQEPGDGSEPATYKLVAVLGPQDTVVNEWVDYFTFDYTTWSGKDGTFLDNTIAKLDNSYSSVIHFPLTTPASPLRGWVDVDIATSVEDTSNSKVILGLSTAVLVNTDRNATLCHNDTAKIQAAINANSAIGRKSILLNAKTYISAGIEIPSNFGLEGTTAVTRIVKLPWSGAEVGVNNNKILRAQAQQNADTITLVGIDIDGNLKHSVLFNDSSFENANYAIDFGLNATDVTIDRVRLLNVPAGGVWAPGITNMKITTSDFLNSGITDRILYSPLVADAGFTTFINSCRFENYTDNVNVSLTDKGVIANNIINNCGSGLFIYGSRFLVSSPNVLVGPANEFLPTPDILSTEYDLVNLDLTEAYLSGDIYRSDDLIYQENGDVFNLLQTDQPGYKANDPLSSSVTGTLRYRTFTIKKSGTNGVEEFYESGVDPITINSTATEEDRLNGGFAFQIPYADVASIKQSPFVVDATTDADISFSGGNITSTTTDLTGFGIGDVIEIQDSVSNDNISYTVQANSTTNQIQVTPNTNTEGPIGVKIFQTSIGSRSYTALKLRNPDHIGWAWSASYEQQVKAADINAISPGWLEQGTTGNTYDYIGKGESQTNPIYQLTVTDLNYIAPNNETGSIVTFAGTHPQWNTQNNVLNGTVISVNQTGPLFTIQIRFEGAWTINPGVVDNITEALVAGNLSNGDPTGQINIVDKFVLAQGRII